MLPERARMTSAVSLASPRAPRASARGAPPSTAQDRWQPPSHARRCSSMLYVIIGHDAPEAREKRPQVRPAHLAHLDPLARAGRIRLAGPLLDRTGSLIVLEADSLAEVWALVARDPYVTEGVFNRVEVKPFQQVLPYERC